jgi:hypothetical protein
MLRIQRIENEKRIPFYLSYFSEHYRKCAARNTLWLKSFIKLTYIGVFSNMPVENT